MILNDHGKVSIAELVFYTPALVVSLWVSHRHGFGRQAGWIFLAILAIIRIVGGSMQLASLSMHEIWPVATAAALNGVGLSPLLLAMLGILKRVCVL